MRDEMPIFLSGGGRMGELIRRFDWSTNPLGRPESWPQSLRSALSICLSSSFPTAIYWGPDLRLLYNDAWSVIPGERHPWALGRSAKEVWSDIWHVVGPQFENVLATGDGFSAYDEMLPMMRGGRQQETYWNYSISPIRGEAGEVAGVFNQGNETTQIVLARRSAQQEIERLSLMFEQAPGATAILRGPRHVFEIANPAYLQLVGRNDILGKPVEQALPEVASQGFVELLDTVYQSGVPYAGRAIPVVLDRNGISEQRHLDFVYQPIRTGAGDRYGIFVQATDVTDTIRAVAALGASEARYQAIVNSIDQMIWSTLPDGFHDYYNDRWYEYTGMPKGSTDGEAWNGVFHPDDQERAWKVWRHSLATGDPYHIEYRLRHRSGEYRWVIGRAQCIRNEAGEIIRWYGTCTDVHDLKMAEEARQLLMQELNHRVKNLFQLFGAMVSMTARSTHTTAEMSAALNARLQALSRAHDLVRVGGADSRPARSVLLVHLAEQILAPHLGDAQRGKVSLTGPEILLGEKSATAMALILHELATNAVKYGALGHADGKVMIGWEFAGDGLVLTWSERLSSAAIAKPASSGFGSRLIKSAVEGQLGGKVDIVWEPSGVQIGLELSRARLGD